jgi:hypothetical protein
VQARLDSINNILVLPPLDGRYGSTPLHELRRSFSSGRNRVAEGQPIHTHDTL